LKRRRCENPLDGTMTNIHNDKILILDFGAQYTS
jgi:hypothetical protein